MVNDRKKKKSIFRKQGQDTKLRSDRRRSIRRKHLHLQGDDNSIEIKNEPRPSELNGNVKGAPEEPARSVSPIPEPSAPEEPTETDLAAARVLLRSARPGTSRRRPMSSMKKSTGELGDEPTVRPTTAKAIANVIVDVGTEAVEEEDDTFVQVNFDRPQLHKIWLQSGSRVGEFQALSWRR